MCLIFIKPKTAKNYLTYERFSNALTNNPHAVGIVYRDAEGINIERFVKPESYKEEIWNIIKDKEEFAIHFRYATHGILNLTNTHPFVVSKGLCMMHNGVMSKFGDLNKDWSDTKNFVEYFLKPYVEEEGINVIKDESFKQDLEKIIGSGNKLLFIDNDFNFTIVNEKAGVWKDGCWLSNTYSIEPPYSSYYSAYAPKDGTAALSSNDTSYDAYFDPVSYYGSFKDKKDVMEFVAEEIEVGYAEGYSVPYTLVTEYDLDTMTLADLKEIADNVRRGVLNGSYPCMWELMIADKDIENLIADSEDDISPF